MLTSECVVSTNWLVSTSSVSSYPASMVNFIWFTLSGSSCQHLATWRHKIVLQSKNSPI